MKKHNTSMLEKSRGWFDWDCIKSGHRLFISTHKQEIKIISIGSTSFELYVDDEFEEAVCADDNDELQSHIISLLGSKKIKEITLV